MTPPEPRDVQLQGKASRFQRFAAKMLGRLHARALEDFGAHPQEPEDDDSPSWVKIEDVDYRGGGLMGRRDA